jgi:Dissimilatory sulfite reductase (desulfoviridin), alpha and beta subunits
MEIHKVVKERCKGCGICVAACPKKALSFSEEINGKGYNFVVNDHDKCVLCGICYTVCPDVACEFVEGGA